MALALFVCKTRIRENETQIATRNEEFPNCVGAQGSVSVYTQKEIRWVRLKEPHGFFPTPTVSAVFSKSIKKWSLPTICLPCRASYEEIKEWNLLGPPYFPAWWQRRFLTKRHLLLWGVINGEGIPTGKHTSTLHLFSRVVNCYTGILCTQSVVHYT